MSSQQATPATLEAPQLRGLSAAENLRHAIAQYPTGVAIITSRASTGDARGFVVGTFMRVSDAPQLVGFLAMHSSRTWGSIKPSLERFCVNIVSEHQEDICRTITESRGQHFEEVPQSDGLSSQPVVHGALAYIECIVESITGIGDHDFVVGRVEHSQVLSAAQPMVYLRGGYGRFSAQTQVPEDNFLHGRLPEIDRCRGELEALAAETGCEVTLNALDGDETVVVAAAGRQDTESLRVRVGQRLPFAAPFGSIEAAFGGEELREQWLAAELTTLNSREQNLAVLESVHERGYAIAFGHQAHERIVAAAVQLGKRNQAQRETLLSELQFFDDVYNRPPEGEAIELRSIAVPVYREGGELAYGLTLWGPKRTLSVEEIRELVSDAVSGRERCERRLNAA